MKLGAVVESNCLEVAAVAADCSGCSARDLVLGARCELLDDRESSLSFHQSENAMSQIAANNSIAFPVPDTSTSLDFNRSVPDRPLAGEHSTGVVAAITLARELGHDASVPPQGSPGLLVPSNASVDRLVTDTKRACLGQDPGNLLCAPLATEHRRHPPHVFGAELRASAAASTPGNSVAVSFLGSVVSIAMGRVAPHLAPNRGRVSPEQSRYVRLRTSGYSLGGNDVPFFLGELAIRFHGCNPFPSRMRRQPVSPLPALCMKVLHLLCESAMPNLTMHRTSNSRLRRLLLPGDCGRSASR